MPLVRIDTTEQNAAELKKLSTLVHQALMEAFGFPENDYFQVAKAHPNTSSDFITYGDYLGVERDSGIVFIQVFLRAGREEEKKKQFYTRTADLVKEHTSIDEKNLFIVLTENTSADWSLGHGEAQYL